MLSALLFTAVLDLINKKTVMKVVTRKPLYPDDLALVANGKQELQDTLEEWSGLFTRHGLKINQDKTEALHLGHPREKLDIALERKNLTQGNSFVYLGGEVWGDGKTEKERERYVEEHRPERTLGEHLCDTGMPVRNGNLRKDDRITTTKAASVRKQRWTKHCKSNDG